MEGEIAKCEYAQLRPMPDAQLIRDRTNCRCILELSEEMFSLDERRRRLKNAIEANPPHVAVSAKALWPAQLNAMNEYKKALQARIRDLMDNDNG